MIKQLTIEPPTRIDGMVDKFKKTIENTGQSFIEKAAALFSLRGGIEDNLDNDLSIVEERVENAAEKEMPKWKVLTGAAARGVLIGLGVTAGIVAAGAAVFGALSFTGTILPIALVGSFIGGLCGGASGSDKIDDSIKAVKKSMVKNLKRLARPCASVLITRSIK